jgi:hypothetical protein
MTTAKEWALANKVKTGLGLVSALAAVVILPVSFVSWAEEQTAEQVREQALIQQGREEAAHSVLANTQKYDTADIRLKLAEAELIELEEKEASGEDLTPTEERKARRLESELETFQEHKTEALEQLQEHDDHETE